MILHNAFNELIQFYINFYVIAIEYFKVADIIQTGIKKGEMTE
jgi:hypothetical protein